MDESRIPESIAWQASDTGAENAQKAKAMMLAFWDGAECRGESAAPSAIVDVRLSDQATSNRSRFMTLFHAAAKSCTNFS